MFNTIITCYIWETLIHVHELWNKHIYLFNDFVQLYNLEIICEIGEHSLESIYTIRFINVYFKIAKSDSFC